MGPSNVRLSRSNSFHFHAVFSNNFANLARPPPGWRTTPPPNREILDPLLASLGQGNIFTSVCHSFCPMGGRVSFLPSMHHRSHDQRGSASRRVCIRADLPEHYRIRSISGRYASYWNAFLLCLNLYLFVMRPLICRNVVFLFVEIRVLDTRAAAEATVR